MTNASRWVPSAAVGQVRLVMDWNTESASYLSTIIKAIVAAWVEEARTVRVNLELNIEEGEAFMTRLALPPTDPSQPSVMNLAAQLGLPPVHPATMLRSLADTLQQDVRRGPVRFVVAVHDGAPLTQAVLLRAGASRIAPTDSESTAEYIVYDPQPGVTPPVDAQDGFWVLMSGIDPSSTTLSKHELGLLDSLLRRHYVKTGKFADHDDIANMLGRPELVTVFGQEFVDKVIPVLDLE